MNGSILGVDVAGGVLVASDPKGFCHSAFLDKAGQ